MGNTPDSLCKWADEELQINQEGKPGDFCGDLMLHHVSPARRTGWEQSNQHLIYYNTSKWVVWKLPGFHHKHVTSSSCYIISHQRRRDQPFTCCLLRSATHACMCTVLQLYVMYIHVWYMRTCDSGRYVIPGDTRYCQVAPAGTRRASPTKSAGSDPDLAVFVCSPRSAQTAGAKNDQLTAKSRPPSHPQNPCGEWART